MNGNAKKSKIAIRQAVISLLKKEKDISAISVTQVVQVANINRGTFYNHYRNIMEVVLEMESELCQELLSCIKNHDAHGDVTQIFHAIVTYLKTKENVFKVIVTVIQQKQIDKMVLKLIGLIQSLYGDMDQELLLFVIHGLAGMYIQYLKGNSSLSLDELGNKAIVLVNKCIQ